MEQDLTAYLREMTDICSVTGRERAMAQFLLERWAPVVSEAKIDRLGSYIGLKRGKGSDVALQALPNPGPENERGRPRRARDRAPSVMIAAHIDTIGAVVTAIEPGGFLRIAGVGGIDRRLQMAQEVAVYGVRTVPGLVGTRPPHITTPQERAKVPVLSELYIDTGLTEQEVRALICIGDVVTPRMELQRLQNGRLTGRYMDNRASLVALRLALEELQTIDHRADLYAVGTVGEEFSGLTGATTTAFAIKPDIAIALDVTFGAHPGSEEDSFPLGKGVAIGVGPNCTPKLAKLLRQLAERCGVSYHVEVMPGASGTDAWGMHVVRGGLASGIISIPIRYMHTPVELVEMADIQSAGRLVAQLVACVDSEVVEDLACY